MKWKRAKGASLLRCRENRQKYREEQKSRQYCKQVTFFCRKIGTRKNRLRLRTLGDGLISLPQCFALSSQVPYPANTVLCDQRAKRQAGSRRLFLRAPRPWQFRVANCHHASKNERPPPSLLRRSAHSFLVVIQNKLSKMRALPGP